MTVGIDKIRHRLIWRSHHTVLPLFFVKFGGKVISTGKELDFTCSVSATVSDTGSSAPFICTAFAVVCTSEGAVRSDNVAGGSVENTAVKRSLGPL